MNRRIVRNQAMRQDTARLIKAALDRKPTVRPTPTVSVTKGKTITPTISPIPIVKAGPNVLFTGGIGDFIAIESFMNVAEHNSIKHVYLATRAAGGIQALLQAAPIFPRLEKITILHNDWSEVFCVYNYENFLDEAEKRRWKIDFNQIPKDLIDYSIWHVFNQVKAGNRIFHPSNLFTNCLANVNHFQLPIDYAFIQPYSPNDRQEGKRDFTREEWDSTLSHLKRLNRKGVVILNSNDYVPNDPMLVNLANKTSICEAMEIAKRSSEYIGVDSCFAALVTKFLPGERLTIKTTNSHYQNNMSIYCAPKHDFDFVCSNISQKLW